MNSFAYVDHLLRNREQVIGEIMDETKVKENILTCLKVFVVLSAVYGLIMGSQNLVQGHSYGWEYSFAAAIKLPILFILTLAICMPVLYVLNVLIGPRARLQTIVGLLMASIAVTSIVLMSCGFIVLFFILSTKSYPFIILLNVVVFSIAGSYGVWFLGEGMHSLMPLVAPPVRVPVQAPPIATSFEQPVQAPTRAASAETPGQAHPAANQEFIPANLHPMISMLGAPPPPKDSVKTIMRYWLITYGLVGTQKGWILRPFVGEPGKFSFFRPLGSNFYIVMLHVIWKLIGA